ncbi:MAG: MFS transporter [Gammaproteobacteria bacterium]|jgi:MFS family permease|nr:MFS transporter [Gammaproteobacteria bacterium]
MNQTGKAQDKGIFFGWWIVAACAVCISTGIGPFAFVSLGMFVIPFTEEFGWTRTEIGLSLTVLTAASAVSLPIIGRMVDHFGSRLILMPSLMSLGVCLAAIPLFVSEVWHLIAIFLIIGTLAAGTNSIPYVTVLSSWFLRKRGLAIGLAISGVGLGYFYVPLITQYLIDNHGWRSAYYCLSVIVFFITLPLAFIFLRESPVSMGLQADGETSEGEAPNATRKDIGYTTGEVLRHREFWILSSIFFVLSFVLHGLLSVMVPMLVDRGMQTSTAAAVAATEGFFVFIGRIAIGYLVDRIFAPYVAMALFSLSAIGIAMFAAGVVGSMAFLAAILIGLSLGAEVQLLAYLTGRYFGLRTFAATYGLLFAALLTGSALSPLAFGFSHDTTGSYVSILTVCVGINILAVIMTGFLGPYTDWETEGQSDTEKSTE